MLSWCPTWLGIHSPGKYPGGKELFPIKRKIPLEKLENVTSQWMPSMEEKTFPCWWLETFGYSWFQASRNAPFLFLSFFALFSVSLKEVILKLSMQWFTNSSCWSLLPDGPAAFISPASWRCWGCDWGLGRNAHQHESSVEDKSKLCLNVEKSPTVSFLKTPESAYGFRGACSWPFVFPGWVIFECSVNNSSNGGWRCFYGQLTVLFSFYAQCFSSKHAYRAPWESQVALLNATLPQLESPDAKSFTVPKITYSA